MRHYRPSTPDLVRVVADFLEQIGPKLESGDRYQSLVCRHILGMVERELAGPPFADLDEAALAAAIRAGDHDADWGATFATVLQRTIDRLKITKPDHLAPEHLPA